jgi:hypothetical protein
LYVFLRSRTFWNPMSRMLLLVPRIMEKSGQLLDSRAHPYYGTSYITHETSTLLPGTGTATNTDALPKSMIPAPTTPLSPSHLPTIPLHFSSRLAILPQAPAALTFPYSALSSQQLSSRSPISGHWPAEYNISNITS